MRAIRTIEVLVVDIHPGWKKATKVTFPDKGDERVGARPGDLVFVIEEKPHAWFTRDGNDLVYTHRLPLVDALCGSSMSVQHLDGRVLRIPLHDVVGPSAERVVPGEGMPVTRSQGQRGDLRIRFDIVFPTSLSELQRASLRNLLPNGGSGLGGVKGGMRGNSCG